MSISVNGSWTAKSRGGLSLGVSVTFPTRCADAIHGTPGTLIASGVGFGLLVARVYVDITWGFKPYNA